MTWRDRLQPEIILTSPSGTVFTATWKGNERSKEKRLGVFEYPKIPGAVVQRMGAGPVRYPLSFYFDGADNDITSAKFFEACNDDSAAWIINHPTLGLLTLELVSVTEDIQPIESGNITVFTTEWIEPLPSEMVVSSPQLEATIQDQIVVVQKTSSQQFFDNVVNVYDKIVTFKNKVLSEVNKIKNVISRVKQTIAGVRMTIESAYRSVINTIGSTVLSVASLAGEMQLLISLPGQMVDDTVSRFSFYGELLTETFTDTTADNAGSLAIKELIATSCVIGVVQAVIDAELTNREDALSYIDVVTNIFTSATNYLDAGQTALGSLAIDKQYFSQSQSFNDMAMLVAQTVQLLLTRSYNLAVAKRFTLNKNRCPIEIAITNNVDLDEFISVNSLKGNDILLLPAGRQVVIYL